MIQLKTDKEFLIMEKGGRILNTVLDKLLKSVAPGVSLSYLDQLAEKEINKRGATPSFKLVPGYHWSICACVNEVVVHGIPDSYIIKTGDVVGVDCGVYYEGFHTDASWTIRVPGNHDAENKIDTFLDTGIVALHKAIDAVQTGNYIFDVSRAISSTVEAHGYSVVRTLVGHGIGRNLHEEPEIPGKSRLKRLNTAQITEGMALAIEIIYNMGSSEIKYRQNDKWTIVTKDGKISGLFEATVAVTGHGVILLTKTDFTSYQN